MLESTSRPTRSFFWFVMAILGQFEAPRNLTGEADFGGSPSGVACVPTAEATRPATRTPNPAAESQSVYAVARYARGDEKDALPDNLPPAIASEIKNIETIRRAIETGGPIERWRFDSVRARYQALLKTGAGEPTVEDAVRARLARLARLEQAAKAAATIQTILAQSHRRDRDVVELKRQLQTSAARHSRSYQAIGFMQPSAQKVDGRKLFVLIGKNGGTVAFLDIPPGLDPDPVLARKVGVRGVAHYNEALQSRLITVRTLEPVESRR